MRALKFGWYILIPAVGCVACFVAATASLLFADEPAHIWLAYWFGATWYGDLALEDWAEWKRDR